MTDKDNITLPREVAYQVPLHELLESVPLDARLVIDDADGKGTRFIPVGRLCREAATALRTALAAETPKQEAKQEPVAYFDLQKQVFYWARPTMIDVPKTIALEPLPLYAAPPATHPGYVIGSHWLETAYSRICAGEAEADVLRDIGLIREEAFLTGVQHLRHENERLHDELRQSSIDITRAEVERLKAENEQLKADIKWLREHIEWLREQMRDLRRDVGRYRWLKAKVEDYDGHACFPEVPYPAPIPDQSPFEAIDAAIDAEMGASTAPASAAADAARAPEDKT